MLPTQSSAVILSSGSVPGSYKLGVWLTCVLWPAVAVLPCKAPLACLPLQAGGDAGSGYGYCTELGQQAQQQGAAAITVSNRTSDSSVPCRLPVVYKCASCCVDSSFGLKLFVHTMTVQVHHEPDTYLYCVQRALNS